MSTCGSVQRVTERTIEGVENGFDFLGQKVALFPGRTLAAVFVVVIACGAGFVNFSVSMALQLCETWSVMGVALLYLVSVDGGGLLRFSWDEVTRSTCRVHWSRHCFLCDPEVAYIGRMHRPL